MPEPHNFTQLLSEWSSGEPQALDRLAPLVYEELRTLARKYMQGERGDHTLQATAVLHEAFERLIRSNVTLEDRGHFFALASRLMRHVLVDHAKSRARVKRDAGERELQVPDVGRPEPLMNVDIVALDGALDALLKLEPRLAQAIELHYFAGMTYEEIAQSMRTSSATVHRDIRLARAWLLEELEGTRQT